MPVPVLQQLFDEHSAMRRVLDALDRQLELFAARAGRPDFELVEDIAAYCVDYPDHVHHPKEDAVYQAMRAKSELRSEGAGDLVAEHRKLADQTRVFADAVAAIRGEAEIPRDRFYAVVHDFLAFYRRHMSMEEEFFFPAAEMTLNDADWAAVKAQVEARRDPLFGEHVDDRFARLRQEIFDWDRQDRGG